MNVTLPASGNDFAGREVFSTLAEPACCGMPHRGEHGRFCPIALARTCDDCGGEPGFPCFEFCSAMFDRDDDPGRQLGPVLVFIDPYTAGGGGIWGRVCDLMIPVVPTCGLVGFTLDSSGPQEAYPVSAARHAVNDSSYVGWVDAAGLRVTVRHPRTRLTPPMILAARHLLVGSAESARDLVAVPVALFVASAVIEPADAAMCLCGHTGNEHDGSGIAVWSCTHTRDGFQSCDCLQFRSAPRTGRDA